MDYRLRWRQRRLERRRQQLTVIPVGLALGLLLYVLLRAFGGQEVYWEYRGPERFTPHFALGATALYAVWPDGHLEAVRLNDGQAYGGVPLVSQPEPFNTTPACAPQTVYLASDLGVVRAVGSKAGDPVWEFPADGAVRGQPLVDDLRLYLGSDGGKVYCLDRATGRVQWARDVGGAVAGAVTRVGTLLVAATTTGQVWGLQAGNGKPVWQQSLGEPIFSPATSADPLVFVGSDLGTGFVLEAATGAVVAKYRSGGLVRGPAAVTAQTICFASTDGWLRAISRDGRTPLWGYPLGGPVAVGPCLLGDRIYVGAGGRLVALDAATGRCRRSWKVPDMAGDLVVTTDTLYVGTSAGRIVALVNP